MIEKKAAGSFGIILLIREFVKRSGMALKFMPDIIILMRKQIFHQLMKSVIKFIKQMEKRFLLIQERRFLIIHLMNLRHI